MKKLLINVILYLIPLPVYLLLNIISFNVFNVGLPMIIDILLSVYFIIISIKLQMKDNKRAFIWRLLPSLVVMAISFALGALYTYYFVYNSQPDFVTVLIFEYEVVFLFVATIITFVIYQIIQHLKKGKSEK